MTVSVLFAMDKVAVHILIAIAKSLNSDPKVANPARLMRLAGSIAWPHNRLDLHASRKPGEYNLILRHAILPPYAVCLALGWMPCAVT